jgi:serine protease Do
LAAACLGGFCVAGWGHGTATAAPPASSADSAPAAAEPLGLQVQNLAPWTVLAVQGLAARAGLHPGDHVLAVNGQPLNRLDQLPTSLSRETSSAALLVERDGREIFIPLHWP